MRKIERVARVCIGCKKEFYVPSNSKKKYCSINCYLKHIWNKGLTKETNPIIAKASALKKGKWTQKQAESHWARHGGKPWNKGKTKETDETLKIISQKISKSLTGRRYSDEQKKKISSRVKGQGNPMYGHRRSNTEPCWCGKIHKLPDYSKVSQKLKGKKHWWKTKPRFPKPRFPKAKYADGIGYRLRTVPELYVALWLQDSKLPLFSDGKIYHYEEPLNVNNTTLYPDFTLATNNTIRVEVSGSAYPRWLESTIKKAKIIKNNSPKDKYILITYKTNIDKLPKEYFDKIISLEGIIEYLKQHNLMDKATKIINDAKRKKKEIFEADEITEIEYIGEKEVYDISVPKLENFILSNGVISHNCEKWIYETFFSNFPVSQVYPYPIHTIAEEIEKHFHISKWGKKSWNEYNRNVDVIHLKESLAYE